MTAPGVDSSQVMQYPLSRECPYRPAADTVRLRGNGPITTVRLYDGRHAWLVTGPVEARSLLADTRVSNRADFPNYPVIDERHLHMQATREGTPATDPDAAEQQTGFAGVLFGVDPPQHTRQRQLLIPAFTNRRIAKHRQEIQRIVDERLDAMLQQGPPADLITAFARPVPTMVVCAFLGVPYEDRAYFEPASRDLFDPERADHALKELTGYLDQLISKKETEPGNGLIDDLVANHLLKGDLPRGELIAFAFAILVAGTVTSTSTLSLGTLALLDNPGQYAALSADPDLVPGAVEELLRHLSVVEQLSRVATEDIEIGGTLIKAGDGILISFAAANLDPSVTSHPDRLDVTSPPSGHLAFSYGIHHCLGHNLARMEFDIAFRALVTRIPTLRPAIAVEELDAYDDATVPRLLSFPVTW